MAPRILTSCAVLLLSSIGFAGVLRVAPSGAPYTTPQAAIDAALDGDTILIAPSTYPGFSINNKALAISVDPAGIVNCGSVLVENLAITKNVLLDSLKIAAASGSIGLKVRACSGSVRIQGCHVRGGSAVYLSWPVIHAGQGAYFTASNDIVLRACTIDGGHGAALYANGQDGIFARGSRLAIYECVVSGGWGGSADPEGSQSGTSGGDGLESPDSFVTTQASSFTGGRGGDGGDGDFLSPGGNGGNGGHGVHLRADASGSFPEVVTRTCTLTGGYGGTGGFWGGAWGSAGFPSLAQIGIVRPAVQSTMLTVATPSRWPIGSQVGITVTAPPGSTVALLIGPETGFAQNTNTDYTFHVPGPFFRRLGLGTVPPNGQITLNIQVPSPPVGIPSQAWYLQALSTGAGSGPTSWLSSAILF